MSAHAARPVSLLELDALHKRVVILDWIERSARTNADHAVIVTWIKEGEWLYTHGNPVPALERENASLKQMVADLRRAHKSTCPGCELCIPGSDYARNRARPDLDLDSAGRPLRAGS